jgi:hypothetical protein
MFANGAAGGGDAETFEEAHETDGRFRTSGGTGRVWISAVVFYCSDPQRRAHENPARQVRRMREDIDVNDADDVENKKWKVRQDWHIRPEKRDVRDLENREGGCNKN